MKTNAIAVAALGMCLASGISSAQEISPDELTELSIQELLQVEIPGALTVTGELTVTDYAMNLLGLNRNKRYSYDAGIGQLFPHRVAWVEEPRIFGMSVEYRY